MLVWLGLTAAGAASAPRAIAAMSSDFGSLPGRPGYVANQQIRRLYGTGGDPTWDAKAELAAHRGPAPRPPQPAAGLGDWLTRIATTEDPAMTDDEIMRQLSQAVRDAAGRRGDCHGRTAT